MKRISYIYGDSPMRGIVHQHHYLLLFAWKLKQGLMNETSLEVLKNYIDYFLHQGLLKHLKKEEQVLFNELHNDLLRKQFEFGHLRIKEKIDSILKEESVDKEQIESLCSLLINVVKYEEKKLIPYLDEKLDQIESSWLRYQISELEDEIVDDFKPEFWINNNRSGN